MTVKIALTRHGETDWNLARRLQGSSDIPLNSTGRAQAAAAAERFAGGGWELLTSSPLQRAVETGQLIAASLEIPVLPPIAELVERHYGLAEGLTLTDAAERWPDGEYTELEPRDSVATRGLRAVELVAGQSGTATNIIVVAHGTIIREILRRMTPLEIPPILNAAASIIESTPSGWRVVTINDEPVT